MFVILTHVFIVYRYIDAVSFKQNDFHDLLSIVLWKIILTKLSFIRSTVTILTLFHSRIGILSENSHVRQKEPKVTIYKWLISGARSKRCTDRPFEVTLKSFCLWPHGWIKDNLTLPTPVVPVNMTDLLIASSFSIRKPNRTVSTVGTSRSKYGISALYLNEGMIFSHGSRRRVSKSTK